MRCLRRRHSDDSGPGTLPSPGTSFDWFGPSLQDCARCGRKLPEHRGRNLVQPRLVSPLPWASGANGVRALDCRLRPGRLHVGAQPGDRTNDCQPLCRSRRARIPAKGNPGGGKGLLVLRSRRGVRSRGLCVFRGAIRSMAHALQGDGRSPPVLGDSRCHHLCCGLPRRAPFHPVRRVPSQPREDRTAAIRRGRAERRSPHRRVCTSFSGGKLFGLLVLLSGVQHPDRAVQLPVDGLAVAGPGDGAAAVRSRPATRDEDPERLFPPPPGVRCGGVRGGCGGDRRDFRHQRGRTVWDCPAPGVCGDNRSGGDLGQFHARFHRGKYPGGPPRLRSSLCAPQQSARSLALSSGEARW